MDAETTRKNELLQRLFDTAFYDEPGTHWRGYADEDPDDDSIPLDDDERAALGLKAVWREEDHPRVPAGSGDPSGQFTNNATWQSGTRPGKPVTAEELQLLADKLAPYKIKVKNLGNAKFRDLDDQWHLLMSAISACQTMDQAGLKFPAAVTLDMRPLLTKSTAHYMQKERMIQFRLGTFAADREYKAAWGIDIARREDPWTVNAGMGTIGVFIHEYGHHVSKTLQRSHVRERWNAPYEMSNVFYGAQKPNASSRKGMLSRYSQTNDEEFFAESFAAIFSNDKAVTSRLPAGTESALRDKFRQIGVLKK